MVKLINVGCDTSHYGPSPPEAILLGIHVDMSPKGEGGQPNRA